MLSAGELPATFLPILGATPEVDNFQVFFFFGALAFVVFSGWRGWQLGVVRQMVNILALFTSYLVGYLSGETIGAFLGQVINLPEQILSVLGSMLLGLIVYFTIIVIGSIAFKKTDQQSVGVIRLGYGASGAIVGMLYGGFFVWMAVLGVRLLGSAAQTRIAAEKNPRFVMASPTAPSTAPNAETTADTVIRGLAQMKQSLEQGPAGAVVENVDPIPATVYTILDKLGVMASDEKSLERFLNYPGVKPLITHPKIASLQSDPEISRDIANGNYLNVMRNPRLAAVANDKEIAAMLQKFEFEKALDYAIRRPENDTAKNGRSYGP